jgi:DNA-binding beta-propeller fold protein YncE
MTARPAPSTRRPRIREVAAGVLGIMLLLLPLGGASPAVAATSLQQVMFVGNNWDGTVDVIHSTGDFARIGRLNVVPDRQQRLQEIYLNPIALGFYLGIQQGPGEGHDQLVDDMYTTPEGDALVVSRPSFADVVSIDLTTGAIKWRFAVSGYRADHMAVSPDGTIVAVSASTSNKVHVLNIRTGVQIAAFDAGDKPHENIFTKDGRYLWNMSIGEVDTSLDDPVWDWTKGDRHITIVDTSTWQVVKTIDMRSRLDAFGRTDLSNAVRPAVFSPDESKLYFQVSFFAGVVEYDVAADRITRVAAMPTSPDTNPDRTTWVNDSRDHGLSMSPDGTKLCVAGTMDNLAVIADRATLTPGTPVSASKPYWATVSGDGKDCVISESGADQVTAIDFATGKKVTSVAVGYHPQRVRIGHVPTGWTAP